MLSFHLPINLFIFRFSYLSIHLFMFLFIFFFYLLFGCPTANFGPLSRGQPHSPDVNHCVLHFRPEGHREPRNEVGSLSPAERLVGFEPGTFRFLLQRLNPLASFSSSKVCSLSSFCGEINGAEPSFQTKLIYPVNEL